LAKEHILPLDAGGIKSRVLAAQQDALLPKLVSGEIIASQRSA